jgi:hypothetical protein
MEREQFNKRLSFNHNKVAIVFAVATVAMLVYLTHIIPEISIAPLETWARTTEKLAIFTVGWVMALRFLGGWKYSVTESAKKVPYGTIVIACSLILGTAIVIASK